MGNLNYSDCIMLCYSVNECCDGHLYFDSYFLGKFTELFSISGPKGGIM